MPGDGSGSGCVRWWAAAGAQGSSAPVAIRRRPVFLANGFQGFVQEARRLGEYDIPQLRVNLITLHGDDEVMVIMTKVAGVDPTDVESLTGAYAEAYRRYRC